MVRKVTFTQRTSPKSVFVIIFYDMIGASVCSDDWEMGPQDEYDIDKLTGLEDFGVLLRPLGLTEKKLVPDPIVFTEPDPLGAQVYTPSSPTRAAVKGTINFFFVKDLIFFFFF